MTADDEADEFQPAWSPDSAKLAFVSGQAIHIITEAGQLSQLTTVPAFYRSPAWSPDGTDRKQLTAGPGEKGDLT